MEGSGRGILEVLTQHLSGGMEESHAAPRSGSRAEI
jgi:hypothetical protein